MNRLFACLVPVATLSCLLALQQSTAPTTAGPPAQDVPLPATDPRDVLSIDAILNAYYESVSGPRGMPRDWDRFRSLFAPQARLVPTRPGDPGAPPMMLTPEQFITLNGQYFEQGGYHERQVHRRVHAFGRIAQVFSTYESRRGRPDGPPYSRGINSIQLILHGDRWWIVTVLWDRERPDGDRIPAEYLDAAGD